MADAVGKERLSAKLAFSLGKCPALPTALAYAVGKAGQYFFSFVFAVFLHLNHIYRIYIPQNHIYSQQYSI
jgi:hypothetical protein